MSCLPSLPRDLNLVLLRPPEPQMREERYERQFQKDFKIRRAVVLSWLTHLKSYHADYRHIEISTTNLTQLPKDGDVSADVPYIIDETIDLTDNNNGATAAPENPNLREGDLACSLESMVPDLDITETEAERLLASARSHVKSVPAPSIEARPIREGAKGRLFAMAFPSLYPWGKADFYDSRVRGVDLSQYATHMLKYHDGRFGRHPRFRFYIYNLIMRQKSSSTASFFVSKNYGLEILNIEQVVAELESKPELVNKIARYASALPGSRPYWVKKGVELQALARGIKDASPIFLTFSCADMQWDDLQRVLPRYDTFKTYSEQERRNLIFTNVQENPHIVAYWLHARFKLFDQHVLQPFFRHTDYWYQYEWQARGSGHIHLLIWIKHEEGAPALDCSTEEAREAISSYWAEKVSALNPAPNRPKDLRHAASIPFVELRNTLDELAGLLNSFQYHWGCPRTVCARKNKQTGALSCRFHYPRDKQISASVTKGID